MDDTQGNHAEFLIEYQSEPMIRGKGEYKIRPYMASVSFL